MSHVKRGGTGSWTLAAAIVALAGLLYFLTAARDIVVGDTGELITAAVSLGVAHPPGYPLFTMLGHLFSLLPLGSIPFHVNLLAVVCDALTVGVVYFTALHLTRSRFAGAVAALVLAVNPTFWAWSLVWEVFPLNNLFAALLIYFLVRWHGRPERPGFLVASCFLTGLALINHHTIVLLAPAFCFVLWQRRAIILARPVIIAWCLAVFFSACCHIFISRGPPPITPRIIGATSRPFATSSTSSPERAMAAVGSSAPRVTAVVHPSPASLLSAPVSDQSLQG